MSNVALNKTKSEYSRHYFISDKYAQQNQDKDNTIFYSDKDKRWCKAFTPFNQFDKRKNTSNFLGHKKDIVERDYKGNGKSMVINTGEGLLLINAMDVYPKKDENGSVIEGFYWFGIQPGHTHYFLANGSVKPIKVNAIKCFELLYPVHDKNELKLYEISKWANVRKKIKNTSVDINNLIRLREVWLGYVAPEKPEEMFLIKQKEQGIKYKKLNWQMLSKDKDDPPEVWSKGLEIVSDSSLLKDKKMVLDHSADNKARMSKNELKNEDIGMNELLACLETM